MAPKEAWTARCGTCNYLKKRNAFIVVCQWLSHVSSNELKLHSYCKSERRCTLKDKRPLIVALTPLLTPYKRISTKTSRSLIKFLSSVRKEESSNLKMFVQALFCILVACSLSAPTPPPTQAASSEMPFSSEVPFSSEMPFSSDYPFSSEMPFSTENLFTTESYDYEE